MSHSVQTSKRAFNYPSNVHQSATAHATVVGARGPSGRASYQRNNAVQGARLPFATLPPNFRYCPSGASPIKGSGYSIQFPSLYSTSKVPTYEHNPVVKLESLSESRHLIAKSLVCNPIDIVSPFDGESTVPRNVEGSGLGNGTDDGHDNSSGAHEVAGDMDSFGADAASSSFVDEDVESDSKQLESVNNSESADTEEVE